jgi:hypothetical protein
MVIAITGELPKGASTYTLRATDEELIFKAGADEIARFPFKNERVFDELTRMSSIGAIEWKEGDHFPGYITNMLYTETLRALV